jgi:uncharacterized membrane protein HdeD (DUF308 family)
MVEADPQKLLAKFGITGMVAAIFMIIFGVLVILFPSLIAWIVGLYLIIVGLINLIGHVSTTQSSQQQRERPRPAPLAKPVRKRQWRKYKI